MTSRFALIALAVLLAACSAAPAPEPAPSAAPAVTADAAPAAAPTASVPAVSAPADADDAQAWLLGTWELSYDPDNSPKDLLVFADGGALQIQDAQGVKAYDGRWSLSGSTLSMAFQVNGREVAFDATVSPARDRITNESGAYYTRVP
ncbi:hypothetical protein [Arenimonas sp. MALMAid1274]|uniref:hypothetical protein n=1 Tax=Arenimonas sp. MALMAid1274 TaxID=3411630 RepID=UPI003B9DC640